MSTTNKHAARNLVGVGWSAPGMAVLFIVMGAMTASTSGENAANPSTVNLLDEAAKPEKQSGNRIEKKTRGEKRARRAARKQRALSNKNAGGESEAKPVSPVSLRFQGSFELNLGEGKSMRGKGDVTLALDQDTLDMLQNALDKKWNDVLPVVKDLSQTVARLPDMLATSERLLKRLADPKTQETLKRADQLLQLLGQLPGANEKKDD